MIGRLAIVALAVGLASCAGLEPAGRNARSSGPAPTAAPAPTRTAPALPPPTHTNPTPAPATTQSAPPQLVMPPQQQPAPVVTQPAPQRATPTPAPTRTQTPPPNVAPQVAAPPSAGPSPTAPARARSPDDDIVVPGQRQTQIPPPAGDPRSNEERRADVRSWDQCVTQVQNAFDSDPMRPQLTTPEEYCAQSLGMADRGSVPVARRQRR